MSMGLPRTNDFQSVRLLVAAGLVDRLAEVDSGVDAMRIEDFQCLKWATNLISSRCFVDSHFRQADSECRSRGLCRCAAR